MSGIGARSACLRFPQLIQTKTKSDMPDSMSISRSSNIDPLHFSQVCITRAPMILPSRVSSSRVDRDGGSYATFRNDRGLFPTDDVLTEEECVPHHDARLSE